MTVKLYRPYNGLKEIPGTLRGLRGRPRHRREAGSVSLTFEKSEVALVRLPGGILTGGTNQSWPEMQEPEKSAEAPKVCHWRRRFSTVSCGRWKKRRGIPVDYMVERLKQALTNAYQKDREDHRGRSLRRTWWWS